MKEMTIAGFFLLLICIAWTDWKTMEIPDQYSALLLLIGIVSIKTMPGLTTAERILGVASVSMVMFLITILVPESFGGGDIKLMAAGGLLLGWKNNLVAFYLAVLTGGLYGGILLLSGKKNRKDHVAFGPFLCLGMAVSALWGEKILDVYFRIYRCYRW
ncbi:MAG: prepilin peptidase [Brotaphodocola sp.]